MQPTAWDSLRWPLLVVALLGGHALLIVVAMCLAVADRDALTRPPAPLSNASQSPSQP